MSELVLSILVISHNQKLQVKRCLDSILSQELPFEYEIVVSDDASTDGTWELEQEYAVRYPFIKCWRCNSDDCHPTITSERSGHNRSNAYTHSSGKYFVHIDADDWYRPGSHCLKQQVELLEEHPECSMCMQDEWCWEEGSHLESGHSNHPLHQFATGEILTAESYYKQNVFANNGVMMMRRQPDCDPSFLYGKWYVDTIITAHHLQFGPIVCLDLNDWIYTQTPWTITNSQKKADSILLWGLDLTVLASVLVPSMTKYVYASSYARTMLLDAVRCILSKVNVSKSILDFCSQFSDAFIFRAASKKKLSHSDRIRLRVLKTVLKHIHGKSLDGSSKWLASVHVLCVK